MQETRVRSLGLEDPLEKGQFYYTKPMCVYMYNSMEIFYSSELY